MKLKLLFTSIILAFSLLGFSQLPGGLPGGDGGDNDDPDSGVPIDNGVILLMAVGAGLGIKKLVKKK